VVLPLRNLSSGLERGILTIEHMTIQRMELFGIVVDDLAAADRRASVSGRPRAFAPICR
jgi:hypothetical protein